MSTWQEAVARWGLVSAPKETEQGQEETAPSSARKGLGWILGEIFSLKGLPAVGTGCPGQWWHQHLWGHWKCADVVLRDTDSGETLDLMILETLSSLIKSMVVLGVLSGRVIKPITSPFTIQFLDL